MSSRFFQEQLGDEKFVKLVDSSLRTFDRDRDGSLEFEEFVLLYNKMQSAIERAKRRKAVNVVFEDQGVIKRRMTGPCRTPSSAALSWIWSPLCSLRVDGRGETMSWSRGELDPFSSVYVYVCVAPLCCSFCVRAHCVCCTTFGRHQRRGHHEGATTRHRHTAEHSCQVRR
jgi:hypothetical protein